MIIGTAGHIDHGKSALVEALTGQAMDPLAEERRRGITMDLHFAAFPLADGQVAGVIDVPGHEDLVRTMVAGAAGLDLVLLVIAADEGIMPQTREHLAVVEQLGVPLGIPVLSKVDLVEREWLGMVESEVTAWLGTSSVRWSRALPVSVRTGEGVAALAETIRAFAPAIPERRSVDDMARLPIDRAFSMPGAGTVVTGTLWSGRFELGEEVVILPGGIQGRVRTLERHGAPVETGLPGDRLAVGLAGVHRDQVGRGAVLVSSSARWPVTRVVDASIHLLQSASRSVQDRTRVRVHLGTQEVMARVSGAAVRPGADGLVRLRLEEPAVARGGDRLVLRSYSPVSVIGGGVVLDPLPPSGAPRWPAGLTNPEHAVRLTALVERRRHGLAVDDVPGVLGVSPGTLASSALPPDLSEADGALVTASAVSAAGARAIQLVRDFHEQHPDEQGFSLETLRESLKADGPAGSAALTQAIAAGGLVRAGGVVHLPGREPMASGNRLAPLLARIEESGLTPPTVTELAAEFSDPLPALRMGAAEGRVIAVERDRYYGVDALGRFVRALQRCAADGTLTPSGLREATGLSRKYLIPLLEWADRNGLTRRDGEIRVPGPRLEKGTWL